MNVIKIVYLRTYTHISARQLWQQTGVRTANPTCHKAMRVQKYEQVFTNIITKKSTMQFSQALWQLFPPLFLFTPTFFLFSFSLPLSSSFLPHFPPSLSHLPIPPPPPSVPTFLFSFFSLFLKLSYKGCTIKCGCENLYQLEVNFLTISTFGTFNMSTEVFRLTKYFDPAPRLSLTRSFESIGI